MTRSIVPFQGPRDWKGVRLGDLEPLKRGISYSAATLSDHGGVPYVNLKSFEKGGGYRPEGTKRYTGHYKSEDLINSSHLLIANTDLTPTGDVIGAPALLPLDLDGQAVSSHHVSRIALPSTLDRQFVFHQLCLRQMRSLMRTIAAGTTVLNLNKMFFGRIEPSFPPLPEQRRIAEILDTIDEAILKTQHVIAKLQQMKKGLLHDLLTRGIDENGELRDPGRHPQQFKDSLIGPMPVEWSVEPLAECCVTVVDCPHTTPVFLTDGVLVVRTTHVRNGRFDQVGASRVSEEEYRERIARLEPAAGDVVLTREAPVGEAFVIPSGMRVCLGQRVMLLRPDPRKALGDYIVAQVYSGHVRRRVAQLTGGTTNPHLNVGEVRDFLVPVPPVEEQKRIVRALGSMEGRIDLESQECDKLRLLKQGLMNDLLTGRVRVPIPEGATT